MNDNNPRKNSEGYNDPTAYEALRNRDWERFNKLLRAIFYLCRCSGFKVQGRIVLRDEKTGRIWK